MPACGQRHVVLLKCDGTAVAQGNNKDGQCDLPALEEGIRYVQACAGVSHSVLLRSDGLAVACGSDTCGQCAIPPLPPGLRYAHVCAGSRHTVLLRSDGSATAFGSNIAGQCDIPPLEPGLSYVQAAASEHTVLLCSDGQVVAVGSNSFGQCNIPPLDSDQSYEQVAAAHGHHTVLLRSDGKAVAFGCNFHLQCIVPRLPEGLSYVQAASGLHTTALLRSDGVVIAAGAHLGLGSEAYSLADPVDGRHFTSVSCSAFSVMVLDSAGWVHEVPTVRQGAVRVLLVPAEGHTAAGRASRQSLSAGGCCRFVDAARMQRIRPLVAQLSLRPGDELTKTLICESIAGDVLFQTKVRDTDTNLDVQLRLTEDFGHSLRAVLPDGRLLEEVDPRASFCAAFPAPPGFVDASPFVEEAVSQERLGPDGASADAAAGEPRAPDPEAADGAPV